MNDATQPELPRHVLHHEPERRDVVRRLERVGVPEVDLVLAVCDLVVRRLDLEAHLLENVHHRPPRILAEICRREVEIAADVVGDRRRLALGTWLEHEELGFHPRVHRVAHLRGTRDLPLERRPWVTVERLPVRPVDVTDDPRDAILGVTPREQLKRREVGREQHVRLLDAHEPFDRRPIEHDVPVERLLELRRGQLDVLVHAENVGELQTKESHVVLAREHEDVGLRRAIQVAQR